MSGKDVVSVNRIFYYFSEYPIIKIPLKNKFEGYKWYFRQMSGHITDYRNIASISLAKFWLLSLGKSETGSLYFDL